MNLYNRWQKLTLIMMMMHRSCAPSARPQASSLVDSKCNLYQKLKQTKMPVFCKDGQSFSFDIGDEEGLSEEASWDQLKLNPERTLTILSESNGSSSG
jgi:hypothetical protein